MIALLVALSLHFTAPATRHMGACDDPVMIPASGSVVFVQVLAFNWSAFSPPIYQQFRCAPGEKVRWTKQVPAGRYGIGVRTISERGYRSCEDVQFTAEAR